MASVKAFLIWMIAAAVVTLIVGTLNINCDDPVVVNGLHIWNCSNRDIIDLDTLRPLMPHDVEVLDFSGCRFTELPHIEESENCKDNTQCVNESNYHCRRDILFSRNEINSFSKDALHGLRCLRTLDLSYNRIKSDILTPSLFQEGTYYLQKLNLSGNPLVNLPDVVITSPFMPRLRELNLSHCSLDSIGQSSVDDLGELRILDISYNNLMWLDGRTFKGLKKLTTLDLRNNRLERIENDTFGDLVNLRDLWLSDNKITHFDDNAFYNDSTLVNLFLMNNQLISIPYNVIRKLPLLAILNLSGNPITQVSKDDEVNKIERLILDNTKLTSLPKHSLTSFTGLVHLSIRGTKLHKVDINFWEQSLLNLTEVNLENNDITTLSSEALPWQQLEFLRLSGNPLHCDYSVGWLIRSTALKDKVYCHSPPNLLGKDLKSLNPDDLQRYFSVENITTLILVPVLSPFLAICGLLVWRRRHHFTCCVPKVRGQYVSVFIRDVNQDGEDAVSVEMKVHTSRLKTVSNEGIDGDKRSFIKFESLPSKDDDEEEI